MTYLFLWGRYQGNHVIHMNEYHFLLKLLCKHSVICVIDYKNSQHDKASGSLTSFSLVITQPVNISSAV